MKALHGKAHDHNAIGRLLAGVDDWHCKLDILSEFVYVLAVGAAEAFDNLGRNNGFAVLKTICVVNDPKILIDQNNASLIDLCNLCNLLPDLLAVVIDQVTGGNDPDWRSWFRKTAVHRHAGTPVWIHMHLL